MHSTIVRLAGVTLGVGALTGLMARPAVAAAGASGAGDPYFPLQGNGGYDVPPCRRSTSTCAGR